MSRSRDPLVQSIQARLVRSAHQAGVEPNRFLERYALERFLYRLSQSADAERFVLKGALLLLVWFGNGVRTTRDADLLGLGALDAESLLDIFRSLCRIDVEPDGLDLDPGSIRIEPIRQAVPHGGYRAKLFGYLGTARLPIQVDVGLGDAVTPPAEWRELPALLDLPAPRLRTYRPETTVAEKLHAMVRLGRRTSRLRDLYDLSMLASLLPFDGAELVETIRVTFENRGTALPERAPAALTPEFGLDPEKQAQWRAFGRSAGVETAPLQEVVREIAAFLVPVVESIRDGRNIGHWPAGGQWTHP